LSTDQLRLVEAAMHQAVGQILAEGDLSSADA